MPKSTERDEVRISFTRTRREVSHVGTWLFENSNSSAAQVGIGCFEYALKMADAHAEDK
jgi:hypothetical protein